MLKDDAAADSVMPTYTAMISGSAIVRTGSHTK
jgi:hypothetical protein